ncbi:DUF3617 domain-containing protein [Novosphingopyxis sp.]|uniref:DUF3617 domain-containing protein n=1 Tax=Novosphingopyxis sp. TaxID=2709690 RepID=UPI003B5AB052
MKPFLFLATFGLLALTGCSGDSDDADSKAQPANAAERANPRQSAANREAMIETLTDSLQPGMWALDFTITTIDAPDAPQILRRPLEGLRGSTQSYRHCLPADQAGRPDPEFFGNDSAHDCTYDTFSQSGDFTTIRMTCGASGGRRARTDLQGTLGAKSFDLGMANEVLNSPNGKIRLAGKLTGKRVGECEG